VVDCLGRPGVGLGTPSTALYAHIQHWAIAIPAIAWTGASPLLLLLGVIGAALFHGDSLITPAISVLSAV
jgi:K+ transporter